MAPSSTVTIVWFRRDLRLDDNPALAAAAARGPVVPVFIWAPDEEAPWEPGAASRWWLHRSLEKFSATLARAGTPLVIRRGGSLDTLRKLARETGAGQVTWNRLYEPAIVTRDTTIKKALAADGLTVESFNGGLLYEPAHVATKEGRPYQVFTPFWRALLAREEPAEPVAGPRKLVPVPRPATGLAVADLGLLPAIPWAGTMEKTWTPGEAGATKRLDAFVAGGLAGYASGRDRPDQDGTSSLSPHLHFGELSPRRAWHAVRAAAGGRPVAKLAGGPEAYLRELGWREFAGHLLFHFPHTTDAPLRGDYARFPWASDPVGLRAWQRGRTGFPVVDAGMRQLWATGWMHNRVRMIVASFLVKDLRVSWLEGARWFWDTLVDADLAANTLGWQWAAGCGADAAPYFRIFNPTSQGKKFDPDGTYVRTWVPELAKLSAGDIHEPAAAEASMRVRAGIALGRDYPEPVVDHAEARRLALEALKTVTRGKATSSGRPRRA
jgi:deoxyribodipyrimidine photo-lyase